MKLIIGLGNPGRKFAPARHNLGFLVVDRIAARRGVKIERKICESLLGEWCDHGEKIFLGKPLTYMNQSGVAVSHLLQTFHATADDLIVVYDDLDLPFGRIRIRSKGSAGGHRGVSSIMEILSGAPLSRVRIGIDRPPDGVNPADYVLAPFDAGQAAKLDEIVGKASEAVFVLLSEGIEKAMMEYNRAD